MRVRTLRAGTTVLVVTLVALLGACSDDDSGDSGSSGTGSSTTTTAPIEELSILVTNDDGYSAEGIDFVVEALRALPEVTVTVVAPAVNRSGTGKQTSPPPLRASERKTLSGYPAIAVEGYPADTISYALAEVLSEPPHVVVSGINEGQNLGPIAAISGTVGAASAAAAAGIPALAASQGLGEPPDYASAVTYVVEWVRARRAVLVAGTAEKIVVNLNVPTCSTGAVRGLKQEPLSTTESGLASPPDCGSAATTFTGDAEAFLAGFATATELTAAGETVTTSTTWPASG